MSDASDEIEYEIQLTPLALAMLTAVKDRREQEKLAERIDQLKIEPEKQGKALVDSLSGFRMIMISFLPSQTKRRLKVSPTFFQPPHPIAYLLLS